MKTLWPRTEPLLAEATEPSRFAGTGRGSQRPAARPSPLTVRRPARPGVTARRARAALAVIVLASWLRVLAAWGRNRATTLRPRHVQKFRQIVPGAPCAHHHSTQRPPLTHASAVGRRRAIRARVPEERSHVRRERSGGPPGLRGAGCRSAAGPGREWAGPDRVRRGRCGRPQAPPPGIPGWPESTSSCGGRSRLR